LSKQSKQPDWIDQKIIDFCLFLREIDKPGMKRAYASIYYEIGDLKWLMEEGWPSAVQHDYPKLIPKQE